jgi:hypothetical protein
VEGLQRRFGAGVAPDRHSAAAPDRTEQQEVWLRAAIDALEDIRADEVQKVSAEVRRSVTRHNQIVPAIAERVSQLRRERSRLRDYPALPPPPMPSAPPPPKPFTQDEIDRMPKWLRDMGMRSGFLKREGGRVVEA